MSQVLRFSFEVEGGDLSQAGEASSQMKRTLKKLGFPPDVIRKVSICMYEGEINMVIHADGGTATVEVGLATITITLADRGPGIPDINLAMEPGWSTAREFARDLGFGAGMGLPNMKRYTDYMVIQSTVGVGTDITMIFNI
jgi:anti-sigma regulatory factor (Ser/Thr protein kinase)